MTQQGHSLQKKYVNIYCFLFKFNDNKCVHLIWYLTCHPWFLVHIWRTWTNVILVTKKEEIKFVSLSYYCNDFFPQQMHTSFFRNWTQSWIISYILKDSMCVHSSGPKYISLFLYIDHTHLGLVHMIITFWCMCMNKFKIIQPMES